MVEETDIKWEYKTFEPKQFKVLLGSSFDLPPLTAANRKMKKAKGAAATTRHQNNKAFHTLESHQKVHRPLLFKQAATTKQQPQ